MGVFTLRLLKIIEKWFWVNAFCLCYVWARERKQMVCWHPLNINIMIYYLCLKNKYLSSNKSRNNHYIQTCSFYLLISSLNCNQIKSNNYNYKISVTHNSFLTFNWLSISKIKTSKCLGNTGKLSQY